MDGPPVSKRTPQLPLTQEGDLKDKPRRRLRRVLRAFLIIFLVAVSALGAGSAAGWRAFGRRADGARRARLERSPNWKDGHFVNPQPLRNDYWGMLRGLLRASPYTRPTAPVATAALDPRSFRTPPPTGLRVIWFGHSTMLIEIDGYRVLTDPIWSERASPLSSIGPRRWFPPLVPLGELPWIDAVVISHEHYDHLDYRTLAAMKGWRSTFVVPLGLGSHLEYWGIPSERIVELDWWERLTLRDLQIVCTPARHASGRTQLYDIDGTLWAGFALLGPKHRAYYSGDTGLFPAMREIGSRLGPFDVTMIEAGQYHAAWPDWHIGPEQAVTAHQLVRGRVMMPVHWGLFGLAYHGWTEPAERTIAAAQKLGVQITVPRPGQSIEPEALPQLVRWWPQIPWQNAAQAPIVSSQLDLLRAPP